MLKINVPPTLSVKKFLHFSYDLLPDLFAIPDFSAGAMENWGLITYRETALLYDEEADPATSKQRVAVVIAHELAHQVGNPRVISTTCKSRRIGCIVLS